MFLVSVLCCDGVEGWGGGMERGRTVHLDMRIGRPDFSDGSLSQPGFTLALGDRFPC